MIKRSKRWISLGLALVILLSLGINLVAAYSIDYPFNVFLPIVEKDFPHSISGQVTTEDRIPVPGIEIITGDGLRTTTDLNGNYTLNNLDKTEYTLIPSKEGFSFSPGSVNVNVPPDAVQVNFLTSLVSCTDVMVNGGFEGTSGWELPVTAYSAAYSTVRVHQGARSLRTGITNVADNRYSYSSGRQTIVVPSNIVSANLIFYLYPQSSETALSNLPDFPAEGILSDAPMSGDVQYVLVTDLAGNILARLIWQLSNYSAWQGYSFDLTRFAGRTIQLHFGTYNDGSSGISSMYVDDVALQLCPTTSPTPTPNPAACGNLLLNTGFETDSGWYIPLTAYSAAYSTTRAHAGTRSMRTGITDLAANKYSYSDAGQAVYIPWNVQVASLGMWVYSSSGESLSAPLPAIPTAGHLGDAPLGNDVQYVLVLDQYGNILNTLLWQRSNSQTWTYLEFNLKQYAGRTIKIQFGVYNNGWDGITSMYVDDVALNTCTTAPTATSTAMTPTATATQAVVNTPTATPTPSACTEKIINGGLETTEAWYIPLTAYPAGYSSSLAYSGLRSMRTGITNAAANVYSYSDVRQTVTIPSNAVSVKLNFYAYSSSGESPSLPLPAIPTGETFGLEASANDVQYLLILNQYDTWIDTLLWQRNNNQMWVGYTYDLKAYAGQTISLQFGTYNNGYSGITSMYFDNVSLQVCTP